jgi:3-oxoacyl-[acyl-carrier-protein] synthase II
MGSTRSQAHRPRGHVAITGIGASTALGRGTGPLLDGALAGRAAFAPVTRFDTGRCRAKVAAALPGSPALVPELAAVIGDACDRAGLRQGDRAAAAFLLALHASEDAARDPAARSVHGDIAARVCQLAGLTQPARIYSTACVAASTAIADAAAMVSSGRAATVIVAAGFLVDADTFGVFDAGRALAKDGQVRPFSAGRQGMLLGDGAAAVVLEAAATAGLRGAAPLAWLAGWGRAGDAYDVCQPHPKGTGLARAIENALRRAGAGPADVGYVNANGTGTAFADASEAAALRLALGGLASQIPVSSTKSVHGHALEASALVELVVTVLAMRAGQLPVNAGFVAPDPACELDLVLGQARDLPPGYGLSLNAAFGGANTALLVDTA